MLLNRQQLAMSLCQLTQGDYELLNDIIISYVNNLNDNEFDNLEDYVNSNLGEIIWGFLLTTHHNNEHFVNNNSTLITPMKLTPIAANQTLVSYNNGKEVLFSYSTPVAGYSPELGYIRTNKYYSKTTTKHINKYLNDNYHNLDCIFESVNQEVIDNMVG